MPCDLPGTSLVIGEDEPIVPTPILYPVPVVDEVISRPHPSHCVARVEHIRGSFHEVIDFKLSLEVAEITASRWDRALEKWYLIFARGRSGWPRGYDIDILVAQKGLHGLRTIFGNRSHNTVLKRANSIIRFIHWFTKSSFSISPFPLQTYDVERCLEFLQDQSASPSALSSLASLRPSTSVKRFWTFKMLEQPSHQRPWTWAHWQTPEGKKRSKPEYSAFKKFALWRASFQTKRISLWTDLLQGVSSSHCSLGADGPTSDVFMDMPLTLLN